MPLEAYVGLPTWADWVCLSPMVVIAAVFVLLVVVGGISLGVRLVVRGDL